MKTILSIILFLSISLLGNENKYKHTREAYNYINKNINIEDKFLGTKNRYSIILHIEKNNIVWYEVKKKSDNQEFNKVIEDFILKENGKKYNFLDGIKEKAIYIDIQTE